MPKLGKKEKQPKKVLEGLYCRKCQKVKSSNYFYEATNPMLDSNGYMSICKDCCHQIYDNYFTIYNNIEIALQLTCQDLDVRFSKEALLQTQSHIESMLAKGKKADKVFGYYKSKLFSTNKSNEKMESFRYKDSDNLNIIDEDLLYQDVDEDLIMFWGKGFDIEDYAFLELELSNWKQTHKCDNQAEITLLREICIKILEIRNKRANNDNISNDLKELQDLMKTASVDPAKANQANSGKLQDAFGVWVKDIEMYRPAEWYEQQEKYKDMDEFAPYLNNYITRPIKNFLSGVRNFFVDDNIDADLDTADTSNIDGD